MYFGGEGEYTDPSSGASRDPNNGGRSDPTTNDRASENLVTRLDPLGRTAGPSATPAPAEDQGGYEEAGFFDAPFSNLAAGALNLLGGVAGLSADPMMNQAGDVAMQVRWSPLTALSTAAGLGVMGNVALDAADYPMSVDLALLGADTPGSVTPPDPGRLDIGAAPQYQDNRVERSYLFEDGPYMGRREGTTIMGMPVTYEPAGVVGSQRGQDRDALIARLGAPPVTPPDADTPVAPARTPLQEYLDSVHAGRFPWVR